MNTGLSTRGLSDPLVVLGMHRSGTSFLVRALNLSGLWLGQNGDLSTVEGRAREGNPKGNYEHLGSIAINNLMIARSGGTWLTPPARLLTLESDAENIRRFCGSLENGRPAEYPRWGWKDPRMVLTLDTWLGALRRDCILVATFRHPTAVARSLLSRSKIPLAMGYALWEHYNVRLLHHLEVLPHWVVRFDVERSRLISQVAAICESTGMKMDVNRIESWFDGKLVRSSAAEEIPKELAPIWDRLLERNGMQFPAVCASSVEPSVGSGKGRR